MKKCFRCNLKKELKDFYKHPQMPDGRVNKCKECNKNDVRLNSKKKKKHYKEYDKDRIRNNFNYIFLHRYSGMLARIEDRSGRTYLVKGKEICNKKDFLEWCYSEKIFKKFLKLHSKWKKHNYCRKLCPSIDRINNDKGYIIVNMQWLTQQENSKKFKN